VLRATKDGTLTTLRDIGDYVDSGGTVALVDDSPIRTEIQGVIRGLLRNGSEVFRGMKAGDIDPRGIREYCYTISDKARAIGGGVLEGILAQFNG
jgi:xanthine dehydrogenase accessory factor